MGEFVGEHISPKKYLPRVFEISEKFPATKTPRGPVDEELARRFLRALNSEYVEQQEGADPWTRWWFFKHGLFSSLLGEDFQFY